jgi:hypothetical protein
MEDGEELAAAAAGETARLHEGRRSEGSHLVVVLFERHELLRSHSWAHCTAPQVSGQSGD